MAALGNIVLLGCGHAHLAALRRWHATRPPVVVTRSAVELYSGGVPAMLRGDTTDATMRIRRAVDAAGGRLIVGECVAIDLAARILRLADGRTVPFELLSLNLGAISAGPPGTIPTQPARGLIEAIETVPPGRVVVAGGGPVGTELALALAIRWGRTRSITLVTPEEPLADAPAAIRRRAAAALDLAGVTRVSGIVSRAAPGETTFWAAPPVASGLARAAGLDCDAQGFVAVDDGLRSVSHPFVLAGGDCAAIAAPRSGALAIRSGAVLARNLARLAAGRAPLAWRPPRQALAIIGIGNGRALAWRGRYWLAGRPAWWLKTILDERWMRGLRASPTVRPPDTLRSMAE